MLEHQIVVIENVMENADLFRKELEKSIKWLNEYEISLLKQYLINKYYQKHGEIINEVFEANTIS